MARYSLRIKKSARKELESITTTKADRRRIIRRIESLADNPRPPGALKLSGLERYRIRQGRYRILYTIEDTVLIVHVIKIGDRKDVYRNR
ncbi:MAG: type II toxin-antitoxin system RelE/ParE family toxin [Gammaproteobacteria bacterium]|nr:type II toxin-antitoxin system RelE/ParE family toxin [Gammaproteobacteria bacterium]